jgi:hypothetical protein
MLFPVTVQVEFSGITLPVIVIGCQKPVVRSIAHVFVVPV